MLQFLEFLPIIAFFAAYHLSGKDIFIATAALMVAMLIQVITQWLVKRTVSKIVLVSGALALVLGSITIVLKNAAFIQWKFTIVEGLLAVGFFLSRYIGQKTFAEHLMGHAIQLPPAKWRQLNLMWVANFAILAVLNVYVMYNFSLEFWVDFKLYGTLGLTLVFVVILAIWLSRSVSDEEKNGQS